MNEILAIRQYHVIYTIPYTGTQWRGSSKCRKQTVCVELDDHGMVSDCNNIFLWHEWEDVKKKEEKKKAYLQNFR